jgi:hypothetical protein
MCKYHVLGQTWHFFVDFMTRGTTINADVYCENVSKLRRAIKNKRRGLISSGVLLLRRNARDDEVKTTVQH